MRIGAALPCVSSCPLAHTYVFLEAEREQNVWMANAVRFHFPDGCRTRESRQLGDIQKPITQDLQVIIRAFGLQPLHCGGGLCNGFCLMQWHTPGNLFADPVSTRRSTYFRAATDFGRGVA